MDKASLRSQSRVRDVLVRPIVSEKSYEGVEFSVYTFEVAHDANKTEIKDAIQTLFDVRVEKVNTLNRRGKKIRNRRTGRHGKRPDVKRAVVTLASGDSIDIFGAL